MLNKPSGYADYAAITAFSLAWGTYLLKGKAWDRPDPYHHVWFEKPQVSDAAASDGVKETRDISQKLQETNNQIVIFWGSQSGTAEGFAHRLGRECHSRFRLHALVADLSDYDMETIEHITKETLVVFIVSTFGEGDPSDNTAGLWHWIRSAKASLNNMRYIAFGLGNSNYKYYNKVVDVVAESLNAHGAQQLMPIGKADDAKGATEEDFITWKENLFDYFKRNLGHQEYDMVYEPSLLVEPDTSLELIDLHQGEPVLEAKALAGSSAIRPLLIKDMRDLFDTTADRNCLHVELDLSDFPEIGYKTGDHLSIWPSNPNAEVERVLDQLGRLHEADVPVLIKSLDGSKVKIPTPTTLSALLQYYLEICAPVSRETAAQLARFAPTKTSRLFLEDVSRNRSRYSAFLAATHITVGRLLEISTRSEPTTWSSLPLAFLLDVFPVMRPRHYSISSSSVVSPRTPSITAVVSQATIPDSIGGQITIPGLATNYLLAHHVKDKNGYSLLGPDAALEGRRVYAQIRKSKFKLPALASQAIIMVAAGTGIAPFRGFIQERARMQRVGKACGKMILYFGCRSLEEDFIYREELAQLQRVLEDQLSIVTAFSRHEGKKIYVQERILEDSERISSMLIEGNANLYICGSAAMAREVNNTISSMIQNVKGWTDGEMKDWNETKKKTRKFQEDVWG
ncbi:putative NADPH-cytochrome P450 reductase [Aureobasidium namibiae CBS 147.97]|uniref:NADPH--cytochrome P450 reductase n=1 Tax=Aureobasidium namibiae CBS 147.97 TaxID=1043004 RepID=A0A074WJE9_9PEZI|nr:putative NADPH-cytochrome P450 reductase [Aureobasidium namibiae CBS 147.97]KEQ73148.1 putative NADPH-cytochrome P450 reductase [Aureobasidium namibiae CBS 147.97]